MIEYDHNQHPGGFVKGGKMIYRLSIAGYTIDSRQTCYQVPALKLKVCDNQREISRDT
jgi:hypothetical protein